MMRKTKSNFKFSSEKLRTPVFILTMASIIILNIMPTEADGRWSKS